MKIYTNTIDLAKPSSRQFWVAPYSKFGLGIKFVANGKKVDGECTLKYKTNNAKLTPSETKIDGYTIFIIDSSDANKQHVYTAECNGQKVDIIQNTTNSTVFEMNNINGVSNDDYYNALKQPFTIFLADNYEYLANVVFESDFIDETAPIKLEYRTVEKTFDGFIEVTSDWKLFSNDDNDVNKFLPIDFTHNTVTGNKRGVQLRATDAGNSYFLNVKLGVDIEGMKLPYNVEGNIISLLDKTLNLDFVRDEQINYLFRDSPYITDASGLILPPKVSERCYYGMFSYSSLTKAPKLPATTLAYNCYESMFSNCPSLTQAPELPATTLAYNCYDSMFMGCRNLTQAPSILPATELVYMCYNNMFRDCYKLSQAPKLPATTLADSCYQEMIYSCKSPFTFTDKTFDEVASLIQEQNLIGTNMWYALNEYDIEEYFNPVEIICSDKTMIATFDENEWTWVLTEK